MNKLAITAAALCVPMSSFAAVLWDNGWDQVFRGGYYADSMSNQMNQSVKQVLADNFALGSDSVVNKITFWAFPGNSNNVSIDVNILDENFNIVVGGIFDISEFTVTKIIPSPNEYEYVLNTDWELDAGNYFLHIGATSSNLISSFSWSNGTGDSHFFNSSYTGFQWKEAVGTKGRAYKIEGEPVPEPATMAVLGLGAAALIRRRRQCK